MDNYWLPKFETFAKYAKKDNWDILDMFYFEHSDKNSKITNGIIQINKKFKDEETIPLNKIKTNYDAFIGKYMLIIMSSNKFKELKQVLKDNIYKAEDFELKLMNSLLVAE